MGQGTFFDRNSAVAERALNTLMAEQFSFTPMIVPKGGEPGPDSLRDSIESFSAVWIDPHERIDVDKDAPQLNSDAPQIRPLISVFARRPKKGDAITRLKDGAEYEIEAVRAEGSGARYVIDLNEAG